MDGRTTARAAVGRVLQGAYTAPTLNRARGPLTGAERALATDLVYGTLRWLPYLDAALGARLPEPEQLPPEVRIALRIGTFEKLVRETPDYALVDAWVEIVKREHPRLAGLANAVLRRVEAPGDVDEATRHALPPWLYDAFGASLGGRAAEAAAGMLVPEPFWLMEHRPGAATILADEGSDVAPGPLPHTLRVRLAQPLGETRAFREGWVQPQNPSSTLPARLLDARPGEPVLDLAAGRGIKTAQLASAGAAVTAIDNSRRRTRQAEANLERLGLAATHVIADLTEGVDVAPARKVLLDAPCAGTGTLRGHPEIKLRVTPADIQALAEVQRAMLDVAGGLTLPGGRLVYAVCTLTRLEGEDQVAAFVSRHPEFTPQVLRPPLPHHPTATGAYLLPVDGLDGFFVSVLERGLVGGSRHA